MTLADGLAAAPLNDLEPLADRILATATVEVVSGPDVVSLPIRLTSNTGSSVVLGHVAATRCRVDVDGTAGGGVRPGRDLVGALAAAVCEAEALRGGQLAAEVRTLAEDTLAARARRDAADAELVRSTRWGS